MSFYYPSTIELIVVTTSLHVITAFCHRGAGGGGAESMEHTDRALTMRKVGRRWERERTLLPEGDKTSIPEQSKGA
jgi:hypothetical protein